ncbi:MAG: tyrosine-type recombinase/integrase [Candidatus Fimenecus sp.]
MASYQKIKTKKGTQYRVSYELPRYIDGKRRKTTKTFPVGTTLSEVKQFVAEKELERKRGAPVSTNLNLTFEELGDLYFSIYIDHLSPTTLKGYKSPYYNSKPYGLKNYFGKAKVRNISSRNIQEYINLLDKNLSAKTIKNYWGLLRILFDLAVQEGIIQREANPMLNKIIRPKQEKKEVEAYTLEELNLILKIAEEDENPDIRLILNLALLSGIRRSEMAGLTWDNVNFDENYIYICKSRVVVEGGAEYVKPPKTNAGIRKIYIPERLVNILKEYHKRYLENKIRYGKEFADSNYVLSKPDGTPFSLQWISNNYSRFMTRHKGEIRYLKFHGLRHTYASILIEQGENPKTVQHNLGHADMSLTLQIYSHSYEEAQKRAANNLERTIKNIL